MNGQRRTLSGISHQHGSADKRKSNKPLPGDVPVARPAKSAGKPDAQDGPGEYRVSGEENQSLTERRQFGFQDGASK